MTAVLVAALAALAMEPVTYAVHRWVMHGPGLGWHRSHHRSPPPRPGMAPPAPRFERNDLYPVTFAAITLLALAAGFNLPGAAGVLPVAVGVSAYGVAYLAVHDLYVHRRVPGLRLRIGALDRLADAHELHHRFGGEPYGMLLPVVPRAVRARAERTAAVGQVPSSSGPATVTAPRGSAPSQVPAEW